MVQNTEQSEHTDTTYLIMYVWELGEKFSVILCILLEASTLTSKHSDDKNWFVFYDFCCVL